MSERVTVINTDGCAQDVPGWGRAEPGQGLAVPRAVAAELTAAPAKADPGRKAWRLAEDAEEHDHGAEAVKEDCDGPDQ